MNRELLVLYDGECPLCVGAVRFLLQHDAAARLRFAPRSSATAQAIRARRPEWAALDSMVVLDRDRDVAWVRSDAVLAATAALGGGWAVLALLGRLVPRSVRDAAYRVFARMRRRLAAGRACPVMPEAWRDRFLD